MSENATAVSAPPPGVYPDVPAVEYHAWDAASNSRLGKLVPPSTPAHLRAYLDEPPQEKQSWREGRVLHASILEPERYQREYRVAGQCVATTKKGERCSKGGTVPVRGGGEVCSTHADTLIADGDVTLVAPKDDETARHVRDAFAAHPTAGVFLRVPDMLTELSLVFDEPVTGVRCKARLDYYSRSLNGGTILDLKGTRDASRRQFTKEAFNFGYPRQSVLYRIGARALQLPITTFAIVALEKEPPFGLIPYIVGDEACGPLPTDGEEPTHVCAQLIELLRLWDRCQKTGEWPSYPAAIQTLSLEEWAWSALEHQTYQLKEALVS